MRLFANGINSPGDVDQAQGETYDYWLDHASANIEDDDQLRESLMLNEVYSRHAQIRRNEVGEDFEMPPNPRSLRMVINGEIVLAKNFETYDITATANLFVHYIVDLPEGWTNATTGAPPSF